jgi:hypothetical protein
MRSIPKWSHSVALPLLLAVSVNTALAAEPTKQDQPLDSALAVAAVHEEGVPGGLVRATETIVAKVGAIDREKRTFTLEDDAGHSRLVEAPEEMVNFPQLAVGDRVTVELVLETLVSVVDADEAPKEGSAGVAATAAEGEKPGLVVAEQTQRVATVTAVDVEKHTATLKFEDGAEHTVAVRDDVKLSPDQVGKKLVIATTAAVAIAVTKQ